MRDCEDYQLLISRMLDDDLSKTERDELAEHVRRCPDCAAVYVAFRSLSEHLREEPEPIPAGLHENIMANVRRSGLRSVSPEKRRVKRWRALLATAACFVVVAAAGLGLPKLLSPKGSTGDSVRTEEAATARGFVEAPAAAPRDSITNTADSPAMEMAEAEEAVPEEAGPEQKNSPSYRGIVREDEDGSFVLDETAGEALIGMLTREQATLTGAPDRELVAVFTQDGQTRRLTLLLSGDEAVYVEGDGDLFYRVDGGAEALLELLGLS